MDKIILTDCDGVLLDWCKAFRNWMAQKGYEPVYNYEQYYNVHEQYNIFPAFAKTLVYEFNQSAHIAYLDPLRDSKHYVKLLHEKHGYKFHVITSMHDDKYAARLRIQNLESVFGKDVFERFTILGCGDEKHESLREYNNTGHFWIEDKIENYVLGTSFGLNSIMMDHPYNNTVAAQRAYNWKDIYEIITQEEYND